jgi:hypothetical protein
MMQPSIWIGFDPRESAAFAVARRSIERRMSIRIPIFGLVLEQLRCAGLYTRPTEKRKSAVDGDITWDLISDAAVSTEFANSRFLVPSLARAKGLNGWALFLDCDILVRADISELFSSLDSQYAVYCVHHQQKNGVAYKMDGQIQTMYARKNWSSFCAYQVSHPANEKLTGDLVNRLPGRELHKFCWLEDHQIGRLGPEWNWLVRHSEGNVNPKVVHFTEGIPLMRGYENDPFADEWMKELYEWACPPL